MTKTVGVSLGPNGPGTLLLTGGSDFRNAATANASGVVSTDSPRHGIAGASISQRKDVTSTVTKARTSGKPFLINFQVEKEDGVYPMIAPGAALHEMVRRPVHDFRAALPA